MSRQGATDTQSKSGVNATYTLLALAGGAGLGATANYAWGHTRVLTAVIHYGTEPIGQIWLRALIMTVVPLVFASISLGLLELRALGKVGKTGRRLLALILLTQALAALVGFAVSGILRPGARLSSDLRDRLVAAYPPRDHGSEGGAQTEGMSIATIVKIVPINPIGAAAQGDMLGLVFFSILFGAALAGAPATRTAALVEALRGVSYLMTLLVDMVMRTAPVGVFALVFTVAARLGMEIIGQVGLYLVTGICALAIFVALVQFPLLRFFGGREPIGFMLSAREALSTAFSTGSSNATLPTTLRVCEERLGLPTSVCDFVVPVGVTMCKNGTALFDAVVVAFLAQAWAVPLGIGATLTATIMIVVIGLGTAGVPGATFPLLILVLHSVGVPAEGIGIIVGVDLILDLCRTAVNVAGDIVVAACVAR